MDTSNFVTIYYDQLTDLFAIVDSKKNRLLDFGIATEVKYAEIFAYKSSGTVKLKEICLSENQRLEDDSLIPQNSESVKSKELEVYQESYLLSVDDAQAILEAKYGSNFIAVENGEFKIQEWQATKKLEHAVCFGINPANYDFSQDQAKEINDKGGIVAYALLNYDKKRHIELLNQQGDELNSKLRTYSIILFNQLNWEIRDQYLELLKNYMEKKINSFNFRIRFCERYESIEKVADVLKSSRVLLSPDENSLDFGNLLSKIDFCCKAYSDDPEPFRNKFEIGDVEFRTSIEKIYLKIQNFLNEE